MPERLNFSAHRRTCVCMKETKTRHYGYSFDLCPLHVLWQVSFGCWVTWSISSWQEYNKSVFFVNFTKIKIKSFECPKLLYMCFDRFILAFDSRDLSQADKSITRVYYFPSFNFWMINYSYTQKSYLAKLFWSFYHSKFCKLEK